MPGRRAPMFPHHCPELFSAAVSLALLAGSAGAQVSITRQTAAGNITSGDSRAHLGHVGSSLVPCSLALLAILIASPSYADHSPQPTGIAPSYSDKAFKVQADPTVAIFDVLTQHTEVY